MITAVLAIAQAVLLLIVGLYVRHAIKLHQSVADKSAVTDLLISRMARDISDSGLRIAALQGDIQAMTERQKAKEDKVGLGGK